jgi:hypothetical protein
LKIDVIDFKSQINHQSAIVAKQVQHAELQTKALNHTKCISFNTQDGTSPATSPQRQQHYEQQQQRQQQQRSGAKQRPVTKLNTLTLSTTAATGTTAADTTAAMNTRSTATVAAAAADTQYTDLTKDRGTPRVLRVWGDVQSVELVGTGYVTRQMLQKTDSSSAAQVPTYYDVYVYVYYAVFVYMCMYCV